MNPVYGLEGPIGSKGINMTAGIKVILGLLTGTLFLVGCLNPFAPRISDDLGAGDLIITDQRSPEEVLINFQAAYVFRDSLLYSDLLDTAFIFVYYDPDETSSGRFVSWGRDDDLKTSGRLFRHFNVIDLVWNATIYGWQDDSTGTICKGFQLNLTGADSDYSLTGRAVFSFRHCRDGRWRITRWKDESDI